MARDISPKESFILSRFFEDPDYLAYPARMEADHSYVDSRGKKNVLINRVTAKATCEKFEEIGILTHKMGPTLRRPKNSKYYQVNESREAFISFIKWMYESRSQVEGGLLLGTQYSKLMLNRQFVVDTLREKGIVFSLPLLDRPPQPGDDLSHIGDNASHSSHQVLSLPVLGRYPKIFESEEDIRMEMPGPHYFFPLSNSAFRGKRCLQEEDVSRFYEKVMKNPSTYFPLRAESPRRKIELTDADFAEIQRMNPAKLDEDRYRPILQGYYENFQEEHVILPILCLIQISPSALFEFLFTDWTKDDHKTCRSSSVIEPIEAILFRMVFKTISDILSESSALDSVASLAEHAYFGKTDIYGEEINTLLTLMLKDNRKIVYEGGFDTNVMQIALNDEDVIPWVPNRENSWIRTSVVGERLEPPAWMETLLKDAKEQLQK